MVATPRSPKIIFFDAAGTLFHLPKGVGYHYALIGERMGWAMDAELTSRAFAKAWKEMPQRPATGRPRDDDDKGWWRTLVERVLDQAAPEASASDRDIFFEAAYAHFATAGVWELYPEVTEVLEKLHTNHRLAIISNFDGRLRAILQHMDIAHFFQSVAISSEIGADKPDALIYRRALELNKVDAADALHVGDDPVRDWEGASAAGLPVFKLDRPRHSLRDLPQLV